MEVENSFFDLRSCADSFRDSVSENETKEVLDESMPSVETIDNSIMSVEDSFSMLRSVPSSARKLPRMVVDESIEDDTNSPPKPAPKFSLGGESTDSSFIGRRCGRRVAALQDSDSDTDDMTPDDDLVMSVATRMSILGFRPDGEDGSDFLDSDEPKSGVSSRRSSLSDLPAVDVTHSSDCRKSLGAQNNHSDDESCTSTNSGKRGGRGDFVELDETNEDGVNNDSTMIDEDLGRNSEEMKASSGKNSPDLPVVDLTICGTPKNVKKERSSDQISAREMDVEFVDKESEIVTLSSDDEDIEMKSQTPARRDSQKPDIRKYLAPKSYPNSNIVYVPQHVKTNELNKMEALKSDLHKVKYLMQNIAMSDLPDGGRSLQKRLESVEKAYREQAERVANMVVEPDNPTTKDIQRDGFKKPSQDSKKSEKTSSQMYEPTWDELRAGSNQVHPKMTGKQAMSTHMAERSVILERLRELHTSLSSLPSETELAPAPAALRVSLMPHQMHALAWLRWRETQRPRGGILADDMGLGKTLTMISLVVGEKEASLEKSDDEDEWTSKENSKMVCGGTLVVCPASLVRQWAAEVERRVAPGFLSVCQHHGAARATQPYRLATHDLVITTYNIVSRDLDKKGVLMRVRWRRVILDEAHIVRNHRTATSLAVSALAAPCRWCLTGTPVQNKELDIFALLKFMKCSPFDDIVMWKKWIDNKSAGGQERLATVMRTLLLRRTKQQLQENGALTCLPARHKKEIFITLDKEEAKIYEKVSLLSRTLFAQYLQQKEEKRSGFSDGFVRSDQDRFYDKVHKRMVAIHGGRQVRSHEILVLLLRLRQVCCHTGLVAAMLDPDAEYSGEQQDKVDVLGELDRLTIEGQAEESLNASGVEAGECATASEALSSVLSPNNPVFDLERVSTKIAAVVECLNKHVLSTPDEKAVVVSQWTSVLSLVRRSLDSAGVASRTLSGAVPVHQRAAIIDDINSPASPTRVLLLSLCAGGVGLNLCGASHLLLLDPHWNPQLEQQAQDRIYRVGQTRPVFIYKFITTDTVEEKIKNLQEKKLSLADNVLTGARHSNLSKLTNDDLKMLFNMQ